MDRASSRGVQRYRCPYHQFKAVIARSTLELKTKTSTYLQIVNEGNSATKFAVDVTDPDGVFEGHLDAPSYVLDPGSPPG